MNKQESEFLDRCLLELISLRQENAALKIEIGKLTSRQNKFYSSCETCSHDEQCLSCKDGSNYSFD
jgi:hypothetical protein